MKKNKTTFMRKPDTFKIWFMVALTVIFLFVLIYPAGKCDEKLLEQQRTATTIAISANVTATALAAVPDDSTTPFATQIADISKYLVVTTVAIFIERFLLAFTGGAIWITLFVLIFAGIVVLLLFHKNQFMKGMLKLFVLLMCLKMAVPLSLELDRCIESALDTNRMIEEAVEVAEETETEENENGEYGLKERLETMFNSVLDTAEVIREKAEEMLSNFVNAIAVVIITVCIIPIVSMYLLWKISLWAFRELFRNHGEWYERMLCLSENKRDHAVH